MDLQLALVAANLGSTWDAGVEILLLLATAMVFGVVAERLRQSAVVGYLFAGTVVGPGMLGWVADQEHILAIAELGVALLLFTIGLEFSPRQLLKLGRVPLIGGPLQVVFTMLIGLAAGKLIGLPLGESVVIGAMVALSSTACVLRVLRDRAELDSLHGRASLGILLVQDVAVVPLVLIVTSISEGGGFGKIVGKIAVSTALAILLVGAFYFLFNKVVPRLLVMETWRRNRDLPILLTVCIAGGTAWSAHALNLSPALGAFVAGVLLAVSPFATQIQADIQPFRVVLVTLFFAAIGMFGDVAWFIDHLGLVLGTLGAIFVGKILIVGVLTWLAGLPLRFAVATGFCLAQIGEFSFVLATIAGGGGVAQPLLSDTVFRAMVSATILSLLATPYLVAMGPTVGSYLDQLFRRDRGESIRRLHGDVPPGEESETEQARPECLIYIIGFGPAGQRVAEELLSDYRDALAVIEINIENLKVAQGYGLVGYLGDATQTDVLLHAGIQQAACVVLTIPEPPMARKVIHQVRHLAPEASIFVRGRYHIHSWILLSAGAHSVVDEENHVGLELARQVKEALGQSRSGHSGAKSTADDGEN